LERAPEQVSLIAGQAARRSRPNDPSNLDREGREGCQDDDDVHHSRLFLFVAFGFYLQKRRQSGCKSTVPPRPSLKAFSLPSGGHVVHDRPSENDFRIGRAATFTPVLTPVLPRQF
jgi:hypothetical protein